ncbi:MAG: hypothetical protein V4534_08895 [Myxococcota bacterium]
MRYSIPKDSFRLIGRYEPGLIADERLLNPDQRELVMKYVPKEILINQGPDILLEDAILNPVQGLVIFCDRGRVWVDLSIEESRLLQSSDSISIGNTRLKVS